MSRNGSGTYSLPAGNPVVTGTTIASTWANNTLSDIASALTGSVASDGQTPMTGNLDLNSNKIVNVTDPTLAQDAATKNYVDTANTLALLKANNLSDVASASTSRTNLGLGSIATQAANNVNITGGSITGITDLAVADGGTGASSFTANNVLLGNGTSAFQTVAPSTAGNVLTSNGTTWTSVAGANPLTSGTAVASTSGTSIDFTSIPNWVKRITVMFDGVSTNGASPPLLQIGTSSGVETSSYEGMSGLMHSSGANTYTGVTSGIVMAYSTMSAATTYSGSLTINLLNSSTNTWVFNGTLYASSVLYLQCFAGSKSLANTLTRVRITTVNGTDTFDAGTINILYE